MTQRSAETATHALPPSRRRALGAVGAWAAALALPGCARYYYGEPAVETDVLGAHRAAADAIADAGRLNTYQPLLVATVVSVDRLGESSRFGRLASEQIAGRLTQRGLRVTELRLREHLAMQAEQGELLLSRELRDVSRSHAAQAVLVGTYAISAQRVFVSLKLVRPEGNEVLAAHDYSLALDANVRALLAGR
jgi:TolB-like protein